MTRISKSSKWLRSAALAVAVLGTTTMALAPGALPPANAAEEVKTFLPDAIRWQPRPGGAPGAQAVLYGNPAKEGLYAFRVKVPAGYKVPLHTHPRPEIATVISGTFNVGIGEKVHALPAGATIVIPAGVVHHAFFNEETVVQFNSIGPFVVERVKP